MLLEEQKDKIGNSVPHLKLNNSLLLFPPACQQNKFTSIITKLSAISTIKFGLYIATLDAIFKFHPRGKSGKASVIFY